MTDKKFLVYQSPTSVTRLGDLARPNLFQVEMFFPEIASKSI